MKTLFIEAKYSKPVKLSKETIEKLPAKVGLASSIQFIDSLPIIKKQLDKENNIQKTTIAGQVLGCNVKNAEKVKNKVDAFLYIGDGQFHPLGITIKTKKPVFTFNPFNNKFKKIKEQEIKDYEKRKKAALIKFLHADTVGIIVSTKPGQYYDINNPKNKIRQLEKKYKDKKFYTFIADTIDYKQFDNFPFIQAWINTACPRIEEDIRIINVEDISLIVVKLK